LETPPNRRPTRPFLWPQADALLCLVVAVLCGWLYFWSARQPVDFLFSRQPESYYELLTAGFRAGHLSVKLEPHPALLALPNPYDPVANAPYRVHDMTFYHGKYYLYFGVTPVLLFFWPVVAATGWYPTEACAVATFGLVGVAAALALLCAWRRRYFPGAPLWSLALGGLCLAFANPVLTLTEAANFYQVPIACAFGLSVLMLGAIYRALHSPRHAVGWMAASSLLFGLAVGARPDYLLAGFALFIPCGWLIRQAGSALRLPPGGAGPEERRIRRRFLVAAFGPAAACGAGLALYNYLRFGSIFEFGMRYQLAGESFLNFSPLGLDHLVPNGYEYLLGDAAWQRYFPFFEPAVAKPYGMLRYLPWTWLGVLAFQSLAEGVPENEPRRLTLLKTMAAVGAANLLLLSCFFGTTDRYLSDYVPGFLLLGGVGVLAVAAWAARRPWRLGLAAPALALAACFSIAVELAVFAAHAPREEVMLGVGRVANGPTARWEAAHGVQFGALRLDLELPQGKAGDAEPLVGTGLAADRSDWVEIRYLAADQAEIALFHAGFGYVEGHPFPIPPNRRISVEVRAGSLLPPFSHPVFTPWTPDEYQAASRDVRISVNGVETLHAALSCYPSSPEALRIGTVRWPTPALSDSFTGRVLARARLPLAAPPPPLPVLTARTPVDLQLLFPADRTSGTEPLVRTGSGDRHDLLSCVYDGPGRLRFILNHFGYGGPRSDVVPYDPLRPHQLAIWMGSLAPDATHLDTAAVLPLARRIVVLMDGGPVFDEEGLFYPAAPATILIGRDPSGASAALQHFTGLVLAADSAPDLRALPPVTRTGEEGAVNLQLMFPQGMSGSSEPLVATGRSGAGDLLYVHYLDPTHVAFGLHHWGISTLTGAPVEIDYAQPHRLEITMDSLYPASLADRPFSARARVTLDGAVVLEGPAACFPSAPYEIRIGANPLGGSVADPAFTGRVLAVERAKAADLPAAALWTGFGAVAMDTVFPAGLTGAAEPLVESGVAGAADLIYVRYVDERHVRFAVDHWGTGGAQSDPVEVDFSVPHRLEFSLGSLRPPGAAGTEGVRVRLDGAEAWRAELPNFPARAGDIRVGLNTVGASSCREAYTGQILTLARPARLP
jgi:hypothetical protein